MYNPIIIIIQLLLRGGSTQGSGFTALVKTRVTRASRVSRRYEQLLAGQWFRALRVEVVQSKAVRSPKNSMEIPGRSGQIEYPTRVAGCEFRI